MSTDLDLFNAARAAGLPPHRAARYVQHVRLRESEGRAPLTPTAASIAASIASPTRPSVRSLTP